jgi:hypothetical protein
MRVDRDKLWQFEMLFYIHYLRMEPERAQSSCHAKHRQGGPRCHFKKESGVANRANATRKQNVTVAN